MMMYRRRRRSYGFMFMIWGEKKEGGASLRAGARASSTPPGAVAPAPPHLLEGVLKECLPGNTDLHVAGQRVRLRARQRHEALSSLARRLSSPAPAHGVRLPTHPASPETQQPPSCWAALLTWQRKRNWWYFQRKLRSYAPGEPPCLLLQKQHRPRLSIAPTRPATSGLAPVASSPARQQEDLWAQPSSVRAKRKALNPLLSIFAPTLTNLTFSTEGTSCKGAA